MKQKTVDSDRKLAGGRSLKRSDLNDREACIINRWSYGFQSYLSLGFSIRDGGGRITCFEFFFFLQMRNQSEVNVVGRFCKKKKKLQNDYSKKKLL